MKGTVRGVHGEGKMGLPGCPFVLSLWLFQHPTVAVVALQDTETQVLNQSPETQVLNQSLSQ